MDNFANERLDTESTGVGSIHTKGNKGTIVSQNTVKSDDSNKSRKICLDDSFEDLGEDQDYIEFKDIVKAGFVEITREEINKVPE